MRMRLAFFAMLGHNKNGLVERTNEEQLRRVAPVSALLRHPEKGDAIRAAVRVAPPPPCAPGGSKPGQQTGAPIKVRTTIKVCPGPGSADPLEGGMGRRVAAGPIPPLLLSCSGTRHERASVPGTRKRPGGVGPCGNAGPGRGLPRQQVQPDDGPSRSISPSSLPRECKAAPPI